DVGIGDTVDVAPQRARGAAARAPLPEVADHRLIQVHLAARPDVVLDLPELCARVPVAVGPRVGLPGPGDLAVVEEAADGAVARVHAGAVDADDRGYTVEVRVDDALLRGLCVEVDGEVDGPARGLSDGLGLAVRGLRLRDALAIAVEH